MAKITRAAQKLFASLASTDEVAQYGSLAAGAPLRYNGSTATPALIQQLSNFLSGWKSAVIGGNSPAIEDRNALDFLFSRQIAYVLQSGVAEWDAETTYYIGSFASDGAGTLYYSLTDDNLNNALSVAANWRRFSSAGAVQSLSADGNVNANSSLVRLTNNAIATMPSAATNTGAVYTLKNVGVGAPSVIFSGGQNADGLTTLSLPDQYQFYRLQSNGTNYDLIGW